ncbi:MAG TPA: hypothetical protein ENL44_02455 [Thermoplasmatales archaeon]|nr:hypothetical protein [Thermoplasmatales archaeon]
MKFICLISTGIDSPVATYLMSRYGDAILVHSSNYPFVSRDTSQIAEMIARRLREVTRKAMRLYILPHGIALSEIKKSCEERLTCVLCKRMMLRYGRYIAEMEKGDAIVTGESLGQVASQTLNNIFVEQYNLKFPVIRPLIGMDKEEIIRIAREIGTYDLSMEGNITCEAVPRKPATRANLSKVLEEEKKLSVKSLIRRIIDEAKVLDL